MFTIDASVWVNGFDQREPGHEHSRQALERLGQAMIPIVVPNLVLVEGQNTALGIIKKFRQALEAINIRVDRMILFGSYAHGTAREESDIDVIVISSSFSGKTYWERIDILTEAIYEVLAPIEASAFTPDEWKSDRSLLSDFAKHGIVVS